MIALAISIEHIAHLFQPYFDHCEICSGFLGGLVGQLLLLSLQKILELPISYSETP
jgi:hypothetical protein